MATFKFGRYIDIHWNGYDIQGPADTVFSIPDQLYEEFDADIAPVEPTLQWIDTNEFLTLSNSVSAATLSATFPIALSTSTSGKTISFSSSTNPNGYLLAADGSGGVIFTPASTSGLTSVVGVSPISTAVSGGTVSVSLDASYQTAGTYVNAVIGTSPASVLTASGTSTVSIDQAAITGATSANNAQVVRFYVKNTTGSTIDAGKAVYVSGATGDNALISLASATSDPTSSKTLGLTLTSIANDEFGYIVEAGYITGIDTTGVSAGSSVWLGNTPGSLVYTAPPAEPSHAVYLGVVVRDQQNNGSILVKVQNGYELDELHDVSAASPTDLDILQYKDSSGLWTKTSIANAGIAASVHTHDYQASGTYVNAVIGTSPASVSTASGTATVSISSGTATSGSVLTANGSGGVSFTAVSSTPESYYITGNSPVNGSSLTSIPSGRYVFSNWTGRQIRIEQNGTSTTTAIGSSTSSESIMVNQKSAMVARMPIGWTWNTVDIGTTSAVSANDVKYLNSTWYLPLSSGAMSRSTNGTSFTVSSALITTGELRDVEYGGSTFVACGDGGGIISSSNGTSWTTRTSGTTVALNAVAYGGGTFLIVGASGSALTSTDGTTWTSRTSGSSNAWLDVAYGASLFVVIQNTAIRTTPDGITWTSRTIPAGVAGNLQRIAFANGVFVIGTASAEILTSSDGITWTEVFTGSGNNVSGIAYLENSAWIASHNNGSLSYSFDNAVTWTSISTFDNSPVAITSLDSIRLGYGNNRIIAANDGTPESNGFTSTNSAPISFSLISLTSVTA